MVLSAGDIFNRLKEFWKKQSRKAKTVMICAVSAAVVIAVAAAVMLNRVDRTALYRGLEASEAGEITARLGEMGVDYTVNDRGDIMVPTDLAPQLKVTLASEGYPRTSLSYDLFSNNSGFMTTDFEKKEYLLFQLQNRLQDSIRTIRGIKNAIVTISLPKEDSFVLEKDRTPATASVVLSLEGGETLESRQIKGIVALVSKSVPGLAQENVAVIDDMGNILSSGEDEDGGHLAYTKLELEKSIGTALEGRLTKLLTPVFGTDGFRVAVNVSVDASKKVSEQTIYTPVVGESGIASRMEQSRESAGNTAGEGGIPGTGTNTGVPVYPEVTEDGEENPNVSESSSADYLVNQLKEQISDDGYEIRDLSVALIIGAELTDEQVEEYRKMAAFAMGIGVDKISISTARFLVSGSSPLPGPVQQLERLTREQIIMLLGAGGVLILLILILSIIRKIRRGRKKKKIVSDEPPGIEELLAQKPPEEEIPGQIVLNETREQALKHQIKDFASTNPEIVSQLIRTWLKEGGDDYE